MDVKKRKILRSCERSDFEYTFVASVLLRKIRKRLVSRVRYSSNEFVQKKIVRGCRGRISRRARVEEWMGESRFDRCVGGNERVIRSSCTYLVK